VSIEVGQTGLSKAVRSRIGPLGMFLDLMTPTFQTPPGPDLNRDTVGNVQKAGFRTRREENIYVDIIKAIEGVKDPL
jgi:hypothetical protein